MLIAENRLKSTIQHTIVSPYRSTFKELAHYVNTLWIWDWDSIANTIEIILSDKIKSWDTERAFNQC